MTVRVSKRWLNKFSAYKKLASITVGYLDMENMNIVNTQMYIDGYQVKLVSDTSYRSLWEELYTEGVLRAPLRKKHYSPIYIRKSIGGACGFYK